MQLFIGLTLISGLLAVVASAHETPQEIESLAKLVCETTRSTKRQFTNVHNVAQLVQFFQGLSEDSKLIPCRDLYLESLEDLEKVVSTGNEDACGEEKIKLLEDFHRKYISKVSKYVRQQKRSNKAPKLVKLFFMQYAVKISEICEQSAVSLIDRNDIQHPVNDDELAQLNQMKKFTDALGMSDITKGYSGTYLFWNMVDSLSLEDDKKFAKYLSESPIRLNVQMREGRLVRGLQLLCRYKLRPSYSKLVLPVLRLVDLGYYPESHRLLSEEPKYRSLFLATQVCETLLPVKVYEDPNLSNDQFVALEKDEAEKLPEPEVLIKENLSETKSISIVPQSVAHLDAIADPVHAQAKADSIRLDVTTRANVISRMLKNAYKLVKDKMGSKMGKMLFKRGANKHLEALGEANLDKVDESQVGLVVEDGGHRVKRSGFMHVVGLVFKYIAWIIYVIVLQVLKISIVLFPPFIFIAFAALLFDTDSALEWFCHAWEWGVDIRHLLRIPKKQKDPNLLERDYCLD